MSNGPMVELTLLVISPCYSHYARHYMKPSLTLNYSLGDQHDDGFKCEKRSQNLMFKRQRHYLMAAKQNVNDSVVLRRMDL